MPAGQCAARSATSSWLSTGSDMPTIAGFTTRAAQGSKIFFFEKKKQKTFESLGFGLSG
jgi:hypothetical protein